MKNYGRRVAATAMLVAGLSTGAVPAFAAAGAASSAPTATQESATVAQCLTRADLSGVTRCLQDAKAAGQLTSRTDIPAVVAKEKQARAAAVQAAAAKVAATQTAAPQPASGRLGADEPGDLPTLPTEVPTDLPTELPTNLPTDLPTGGPTDLPTVVLPTDPTSSTSQPSTPTDGPSVSLPTQGGGSGGNGGAGGTGGNGGNGGAGGNGGTSAGNGAVNGAGSSPEGVVSSNAQTSVPVNSACSDAAICQAAAAPTTSTSTSGANGLADTGAPAHAEGYLALGAALVLGGGLLISRPRRVLVEA